MSLTSRPRLAFSGGEREILQRVHHGKELFLGMAQSGIIRTDEKQKHNFNV